NAAEAEASGASEPRPLPAQVLDHATGYLMAFGAMTALARRAERGGSWHVRASLAQTGYWVRQLGRVDNLACPDPGFDDVRDRLGRHAVRLRPPDGRAPRRRHDGNAAPLGAANRSPRHPCARLAISGKPHSLRWAPPFAPPPAAAGAPRRMPRSACRHRG